MMHFIVLFLILLIIFAITSKGRLFYIQNNTSKFGYILCLIILCLLSSLKASTVGNDTHEYLRLYEMGDNLLLGETRYEIGYLYYNVIIKRLFDSPQMLFVITSIIIYFSLGRLLWRHSSIPWLSIMIFFSYTLFGFTMSSLRQSIAISILFWGYDFVVGKKYLPFVLIVFFASLFHVSAIFFILFPLLNYFTPRKKTIVLFIVFSLSAYLFLSDILRIAFGYLSDYSHYQEGVYFEGDVRLASILQLLMAMMFFLIAYYSYKNVVFVNNYITENHLDLLIMLQMVAVSLSLLCLKVNIIDRVVLYYSSFVLLLLPNALVNYSLSRRTIWIIIILLILFLYTLIILIYRPNWNSVYPYSFFWEESRRMIY